jgi:hypothetical protein
VSFTVAVVGLAGLAWLAWVLLGVAGYRHNGAPALKDTVSVLQLVFATVAGAGALVALIVAYRRQKITEADSVHDRTRVFNERFTAIAAQLGDVQPAVRLAGVHAMAGLADDWKQNRQTCVDVLCAYLRLPYDPAPGDEVTTHLTPSELEGALARRAAYQANREVRHTIIRLIGAHLRPGAAASWQGLNFDFTEVVFDGVTSKAPDSPAGPWRLPPPGFPAVRSTSTAPSSPAARSYSTAPSSPAAKSASLAPGFPAARSASAAPGSPAAWSTSALAAGPACTPCSPAARSCSTTPSSPAPRSASTSSSSPAAKSTSSAPGSPAARSASAAPGSPRPGRLRPRQVLRRHGRIRRRQVLRRTGRLRRQVLRRPGRLQRQLLRRPGRLQQR